MKNKNGFTLLEVVISMGLLVILITATVHITRYTMVTNARLLAQSELFHQATVAMEFISAHIDSAYAIRPSHDSIRIRRMEHFPNRIDIQENNIFFSSSNNRLNFSGAGNEFARYIQYFVISKSNYLLYITIVTTDRIENNSSIIEPITLNRAFDISNKNFF